MINPVVNPSRLNPPKKGTALGHAVYPNNATFGSKTFGSYQQEVDIVAASLFEMSRHNSITLPEEVYALVAQALVAESNNKGALKNQPKDLLIDDEWAGSTGMNETTLHKEDLDILFKASQIPTSSHIDEQVSDDGNKFGRRTLHQSTNIPDRVVLKGQKTELRKNSSPSIIANAATNREFTEIAVNGKRRPQPPIMGTSTVFVDGHHHDSTVGGHTWSSPRTRIDPNGYLDRFDSFSSNDKNQYDTNAFKRDEKSLKKETPPPVYNVASSSKEVSRLIVEAEALAQSISDQCQYDSSPSRMGMGDLEQTKPNEPYDEVSGFGAIEAMIKQALSAFYRCCVLCTYP